MDANSIINKLLSDRVAADKQKEIVVERVEEFKDVVNRLFQTSDGVYFAKYLLRYTQYQKSDLGTGQPLLENLGKRKVYAEFIRPHLTLKTIGKIENQN